jgi:hypothetical protein
MKQITDKIAALTSALKGKKPSVIIATIVIFILGILGVKYGYIPESLLNVNLIVDQVSSVFGKDSVQVVIDTLPK